MSEVTESIERFRRLIDLQETREMSFMAQQWIGVENNIQANIDRLVMEVNFMVEQGQPVNVTRLMQLEQYQDLLRQLRVELTRYNQWASGLISENQALSARMGIRNSEEVIQANFTDRNQVVGTFKRLPFEAVEFMIGNASDGTPLNRLLMESFPETVANITSKLIQSTALGVNPRETAKQMTQAMGGNFQRALTTARTEQLRVFRAASTEAARESEIVDGWIWRAALQLNTCRGCIAKDGTRFPITEDLEDHPNGRCFRQWIIKDLKPVHVQSGETWLRSQSADDQRQLLGASAFKAWKDGDVEFSQFAQISKSRRWGASVQPAPLKDIL